MMRRLAGLGLMAVLAAGCSTSAEDEALLSTSPKVRQEPMVAPEVPGVMMPGDAIGYLRTPEVIHPYHVGRYIDPRSGTMQEATIVYEVQQSAGWVVDPPPGKYQAPFEDLRPYTRMAGTSREQAAEEIVSMSEQTRRLNRDTAEKYNRIEAEAKAMQESKEQIITLLKKGKESSDKVELLQQQLEVLVKQNQLLQQQLDKLIAERAKQTQRLR